MVVKKVGFAKRASKQVRSDSIDEERVREGRKVAFAGGGTWTPSGGSSQSWENKHKIVVDE